MSDDIDDLDDFNHIGPQYRLRASAIERAVAEERERCAKIAESAVNSMNGQRKAGMVRAIAKRIREGDKP